MKNLIVDLDGTLADDTARAKLYLNQPCTGCASRGWNMVIRDGESHREPCPECDGRAKKHLWTPYFEACDRDEPNIPVITALRALRRTLPGDVFIMSGRCESVRQKTEDWLDRHNVLYERLIMRPVGNRVDDHILKIQWGLEVSPPKDTLLVLEDRQRVVDAWRKAGYTCFQVAPGHF
jgi:hypothetical protein